MATFYLRPSADVSLGHSCSSGSTGYNLINEATADDDSTYIYKEYDTSTSSKSTTTSSSFTATGTLELKYVISSAKLVVRAKRCDDANSDSTISATIGTSSMSAQTLTTSYSNFEATVDTSNITRSGTSLSASLQLTTFVKADSKNETATARITQAFIQIECTELPEYTITTSVSGPGTISSDSPIVQGYTGTVTITPHANSVFTKLTDDGVDVTSQAVSQGTYYTYTISNMQANHTVIAYIRSKFFVKVDGSWIRAKSAWIKQSGTWTQIYDNQESLEKVKYTDD